jgi:hypothetical protein
MTRLLPASGSIRPLEQWREFSSGFRVRPSLGETCPEFFRQKSLRFHQQNAAAPQTMSGYAEKKPKLFIALKRVGVAREIVAD